MIYAVITLATLLCAIYISGCFLMRALLKISDTDDQDDLYPVMCWPLVVAQAIGEIIFTKDFKW